MNGRLVGVVLAGVTPGGRHEIPGAITDLLVVDDLASASGSITLRVEWAVPDHARAEDAIGVDLPDVFDPRQAYAVDVTDDDGVTVARASVARRRLTLTLTREAESRVGARGAVSLPLRFAPDAVQPGRAYGLAFIVGSRTYTDVVRATAP